MGQIPYTKAKIHACWISSFLKVKTAVILKEGELARE